MAEMPNIYNFMGQIVIYSFVMTRVMGTKEGNFDDSASDRGGIGLLEVEMVGLTELPVLLGGDDEGMVATKLSTNVVGR
jgi:hypothetical protein